MSNRITTSYSASARRTRGLNSTPPLHFRGEGLACHGVRARWQKFCLRARRGRRRARRRQNSLREPDRSDGQTYEAEPQLGARYRHWATFETRDACAQGVMPLIEVRGRVSFQTLPNREQMSYPACQSALVAVHLSLLYGVDPCEPSPSCRARFIPSLEPRLSCSERRFPERPVGGGGHALHVATLHNDMTRFARFHFTR
jgi:hypothetical protein